MPTVDLIHYPVSESFGELALLIGQWMGVSANGALDWCDVEDRYHRTGAGVRFGAGPCPGFRLANL